MKMIIRITFVLLLLPFMTWASDDDYGLPNVVLPELTIKDATVTDAVRIALEKARQQDPRVNLASVIVHEPKSSVVRVTLSFKNVPLLTALHLMAESAFYEVVVKNKTMEMRPTAGGVTGEEATSVLVVLHPNVLRDLNINLLDERSLKSLLKELKIDPSKIDGFTFLPDGHGVLIKGRGSEMQNIQSIISLLNRGLRIEK